MKDGVNKLNLVVSSNALSVNKFIENMAFMSFLCYKLCLFHLGDTVRPSYCYLANNPLTNQKNPLFLFSLAKDHKLL